MHDTVQSVFDGLRRPFLRGPFPPFLRELLGVKRALASFRLSLFKSLKYSTRAAGERRALSSFDSSGL